MSGVLVVLEGRDGSVSRISWEALAAGRQLAVQTNQPLDVAVIGGSTEPLATQAAAKSVARVIRVEHPLLARYTSDGYTMALHQLIQKESPAQVVFPHTYQVVDYAPALAARLQRALISSVVAIGDGPIFKRLLMQGRLIGAYRPEGDPPWIVSVQAGSFPADEIGCEAVEVSTFEPKIAASSIRTRPGEPYRGASHAVDLSKAPRIVAVGRGIQVADNLALVQDLAESLGAELAASRPVCDNGWLSIDRQIGSSGQTVSPRLYLAVGISGAVQHLVGMKGSQCIVAINKDRDAPIFDVADYGIVGDFLEVVPAITEALNCQANPARVRKDISNHELPVTVDG